MSGRSSFIAVLAVLGAGFVASSPFAPRAQLAAEPAAKPASRIGLVNIADVLKDSDATVKRGNEIKVRRQQFLDKVTALRNEMADLTRKLGEAAEMAEKVTVQKQITKLQRQMEDIDRDAQTKLQDLSNGVIVDVYREIRETIAEIAAQNDLDLVLMYPASKEMSPAVAQLMLQTPAAMPVYSRPEMDLTKEVVLRLNRKFPADKPAVGAK